jgi:organic radical activating enzyme
VGIKMIDYHKLEHEHEFAKNTVVINWCLLNKCNYKCSYCPDYLHNGSSGRPDYDEVTEFCTNVIDHYQGKNIYFEFTGGEVTYWKDLPMLVEFLKTHEDVYVGVISNGSQKLSWWDKMKRELDHACLSFQPEFSNREHYIKLARLISGHMRTHVNLMMHPDHFIECISVVDELVETVRNISVALQPLSVDFKDELYKYTPSQLDIIDKQFELYGSKVKWDKDWPIFRGSMKVIGEREMTSSSHRFISEGVNRWKGWRCYIGVEQIVVDTDGRIWRGWCMEGGCLGYIKNYVKLPEDPIICGRDYCHCNFDIMCTKEKI